jgi:hypothetical protein
MRTFLKRIASISFLMLLLIGKGFAQSNQVDVASAEIICETKFNHAADSSHFNINDTITYKIIFKLSNLHSVNEVYLDFGTSQNGTQLSSVILTKQQINNDKYFKTGPKSYKVWNDRGYCIVQFVHPPNTKWLTIYAKGPGGVLSTKKYVKF